MSFSRVLASAILALSLSPGPVFAQQDAELSPRCSILGQMAVSNWLSMLGALSSNRPAEVDPDLRRTAQTVELYRAVGCDAALIETSFDCLLTTDQDDDRTRAEIARGCMAEAGIIAGE